MELIKAVIHEEWTLFTKVQNEGGRASCQDNYPEFYQMRYSQFSQWPTAVLESYRGDLAAARTVGRNLVMEKYARMMAYTAPKEYEGLRPYLPKLSPTSLALIDRITALQVQWHRAFSLRYPKIAARGRSVSGTAAGLTSAEVYLRGELATYSEQTLALYSAFLNTLTASGINLVERTIESTARLAGYQNLDEAEAALL